MSDIVLKTEHRRAIAKHGETAYPLECQGLLLGHRNGSTKEVIDIVLGDSSTQPESQKNPYHIPDQEMQAGEARASANGLKVIGSFHSRVDAPARPSLHDRGVVEPTFSYVMVGIRDGRAHELTAWKLSEDGDAFHQEVIRRS